jgi:hypothetical protein
MMMDPNLGAPEFSKCRPWPFRACHFEHVEQSTIYIVASLNPELNIRPFLHRFRRVLRMCNIHTSSSLLARSRPCRDIRRLSARTPRAHRSWGHQRKFPQQPNMPLDQPVYGPRRRRIALFQVRESRLKTAMMTVCRMGCDICHRSVDPSCV